MSGDSQEMPTSDAEGVAGALEARRPTSQTLPTGCARDPLDAGVQISTHVAIRTWVAERGAEFREIWIVSRWIPQSAHRVWVAAQATETPAFQ